jgi:RNA polymerase sigma-70 factor (ECF subfamily)
LVDVDKEIIEAIRKGNVRRFGDLVDRHKNRAMTLALRIVGDTREAEELVQDAFLRAYRGLDSFRGDARFSTWLYRILYNVCMTKALRRPRKDTLNDLIDEGHQASDSAEDSDPSILEQLESQETLAMLHEELEQLPPHFRIALTLFYVQEMSYDEMAAVLEAPMGTIKTNLSRGRALLRQRVLQRIREEEFAR